MPPAGSTASRAAAVQWKSLMTQIGVGMGAASFWRGAWYILDDVVFPDDASASAMTCLATGTLGMAASQHWLAQTTTTQPRVLPQSTTTLLQRIPRMGALYSMALSCVLVWRGTWVGWDCLYEAYANHETHSQTNKEKKEVEGNKPEEAKSSRYWMLDALLPVATAAQASPHNSSSNSTTTGHWSPKLPTPRITSSSSSAMMATSHYASPLPHHQHAHHHDFHPQQHQPQHAEPQELQDHPIIKSTDPGHATTSGVASHVLAMAVLASLGVFASVLAPPAGICVLRDAVVLANKCTTTTTTNAAKKVLRATTNSAPRIPKAAAAAAAAAAQQGTTTYFGRHAPPMTSMAYSTTNATTTKNIMRRPPTLTTSTSLIQTAKISR